MKKYKKIFKITENSRLNADSVLMKLVPVDGVMPDTLPGQFVNILVPQAPGTFLRRPISICNIEDGELRLFIKAAGKGSRRLCSLKKDDELDIILPLGTGFSLPVIENKHILLIGGGVGVAPLLYMGKILVENGFKPKFLIGAATESALCLIEKFASLGKVHITTDDGSREVKGNVLAHPVLNDHKPDMIYCCGPTPMMKGVAQYATANNITCEVSLENQMACGIGACLCCVQNTKEGHKCVCTAGPVFNIDNLDW